MLDVDFIISSRKFPFSPPFSLPTENSIKFISNESKHPDGQRDDLSLTEGMDLLSSQMFEILLPPACIIEKDVNYPYMTAGRTSWTNLEY
jgi:hypothetical protein